jgi:DNA invertase Pin-like site-specific DNA recombinase
MPTDVKVAAAYIRVSTDDQVEYSPEAQLVEIRKYAAGHGYILPEEFIFQDDGISGRKAAKRDSFNRMIGVAKTKPKPFDAILLWKFSRFARNREDSVVYKSMLRKQLGIDVISVSEPVGDDKMSVIIEALIEAMDEYYSINLGEEVKRGMSEKARRGELQSNPSFGYTVKDNRLIPVPEEAELVREMFRRYQSGMGFFPIAKWLNSIGVKTHRGGAFENRTVEYILRNPVYIGKLRWNPTGRSRRDFDNENIILADADHEPLIDMDTWNTVQSMIRQQKATMKYKARPTYEKKDWLSGIVRCSVCGGTLIFSHPHYFKCNNYVRGRCSASQHTKVDILHNAVLDRLREDCGSETALDYKVIHQTDTGAPELSALERSLSSIQHRKERLREAFLSGADSVEEYAQMKHLLTQEEEVITSRIAQLRAIDTATDTLAVMRRKIADTLQTLEAPDATIDQKFNAANSVIESCRYSKSTGLLEITYRLVF